VMSIDLGLILPKRLVLAIAAVVAFVVPLARGRDQPRGRSPSSRRKASHPFGHLSIRKRGSRWCPSSGSTHLEPRRRGSR
jgi:hypothetical protein